MKTLKELVELQWLTGASDEEIITQWLLENNVAEKGIEIISQLALGKIKSQQETLAWLHNDLTMLGSEKHLIEIYGVEDGCQMNMALRYWIITTRMGRNFEEDYPRMVEWLKKFAPTKKQPLVFWRSFMEWLNEKGIYFKDQKKGGKNETKRKD